MGLDRRGLGWAATAGAVGAALAVLLLKLRYGSRPSVVLGSALGVATTGLTLALGLFAWTLLSGVDGDSLYPAAAGVLSASVPTAGTAGTLSSSGEPRTTQVLLVGVGVLVAVGFTLLFLSELGTGER